MSKFTGKSGKYQESGNHTKASVMLYGRVVCQNRPRAYIISLAPNDPQEFTSFRSFWTIELQNRKSLRIIRYP